MIRGATDADREAVEAIVAAAYAEYPPRLGVRPMPMDEDYAAVIARGDTWVDQRDGTVVGVLVLATEPDGLLIENVAVDPERQGEGVGRGLLARAEAEARARGLAQTRLYTHQKMSENIALYRRLGYVESRRGADSGFPRVYMHKDL
jgi:ribosomal protein S18 acetylase RimI-like enzyme